MGFLCGQFRSVSFTHIWVDFFGNKIFIETGDKMLSHFKSIESCREKIIGCRLFAEWYLHVVYLIMHYIQLANQQLACVTTKKDKE